MSEAWWIVGDTLTTLRALPDSCVDVVLTSPPFLALRSYLPADDPNKPHEIGQEATPGAFLDVLLDITEELGRVLTPHGSLCVELGDTFSMSGGAGGDYAEDGLREGQPVFRQTRGEGWPLAKSLALIPESYRLALAYGRNPHTGRTTDPWRVRNVVRWCRPNPPVGCVDDLTEALTPDGWKRHTDLQDGDLIAAYDADSDSCRFQPAKFVRWHRENEPMVSIEKRKTSQRLTLDHRCLVRTDKRSPFVALAADLTNEQQVLLSAPLEEVPGPEPTTTERAELLGWFIAEGTAKHRQALISQSLTSNPAKVDRLRSLLERDGADFTESNYRRTTGVYGGHVQTTFVVKGELAAWLNLHHKRLPMQYVTTWPTRTLRALYDGLIDGDGHRRKAGGVLFFQKEREVCDAVQVLAIRLGLRASLTRQDRMDGWQVTIGDPEHYEAQRWTKVRKWDGVGIPQESYTGVVWCPQVETSFWLARRDGRTFVTGNSLGDKFRPATSEMVVACKSGSRWFDLDAVRTEHERPADANSLHHGEMGDDDRRNHNHGNAAYVNGGNEAGAPPLDWWEIPTAPEEVWQTDAGVFIVGGGETAHQVRVQVGVPGDGIRRTTSPSCPAHGSEDHQGSSAPGGERAGSGQTRSAHTDARPARGRPADSPPTSSSTAPTDDAGSPVGPSAKRRSSSSSRTAPAPETTTPGTPSARKAARTDGTSASPESSAPGPDTAARSTPVAGSAGSPDSRTTPRTDGTSDEQGSSEACTCSYWVELGIPQDTGDYAGIPPDWWNIPTHGYAGSHYATFPPALVVRPVEAMCPRQVCEVCGVPRRRLTSEPEYVTANGDAHGGDEAWRHGRGGEVEGMGSLAPTSLTRSTTTLGWSDCGHGSFRPGVVLDPFGGSGTTAAVATGHGRDCLSIDLDARNADLARERVGMWLTETTAEEWATGRAAPLSAVPEEAPLDG